MTRAEVNLTTSETQSLSPYTSLISWVSGGTASSGWGPQGAPGPLSGEGELQRQRPSGPNTTQGSLVLGVHLDALQSLDESMVKEGAW